MIITEQMFAVKGLDERSWCLPTRQLPVIITAIWLMKAAFG
jgi:hypothetical protein